MASVNIGGAGGGVEGMVIGGVDGGGKSGCGLWLAGMIAGEPVDDKKEGDEYFMCEVHS